MSYLIKSFYFIILIVISNNAYSDNARLSYTCKSKLLNKLEFKWSFKGKVSDNNFFAKHTTYSSFFKRKITRSFSGNERMGTFFVSSRFESMKIQPYEIKFDRKRMKTRSGLDFLKKGIKGSERNLKCEIKLVKLITTPGFDKKNVKNFTNNEICKKATVINKNDKKVWGSYLINKKYVKEAKIRALDCGVYNRDKEIEKEKKFAKRLALAQKKLEEENKKRIAKEKEEKKKRAEEDKRNKAKRLALAEKILEEKRKKKIAEEKARKKKEAAERARKKKLAEQERKRKLEQEKIAKKIKDYKREAINFYKDIEEFVKSGGKIDLVKLSKLFNVKPDPKKNWNSPDLKTYENLRQFMSSVSEFVSYEKQMIGERLKKSFALKDQSIAQLEKNLGDLKGLMRKMFGSSDTPQITKMISDIEASLNNFNQSKANRLIAQTTNYISSKLDKPKIVEKNKQTKVAKKASADQSWLDYKSKMSIQQGQFCQLTDSFFDDLDNARKSKNEIKVNIVHKDRQGDLDALIPGGKISNWIFKVVKIDQVEDGSAAVVLSLQCKSYVGSGQIHTKSTWRKKSNKEWRATIPYNDRRFRELAKLNAGEFVVASGMMLEIGAYKPGQKETFYASQQIGEHPLTKGLNLKGELFVADLTYIAALN